MLQRQILMVFHYLFCCLDHFDVHSIRTHCWSNANNAYWDLKPTRSAAAMSKQNPESDRHTASHKYECIASYHAITASWHYMSCCYCSPDNIIATLACLAAWFMCVCLYMFNIFQHHAYIDEVHGHNSLQTQGDTMCRYLILRMIEKSQTFQCKF